MKYKLRHVLNTIASLVLIVIIINNFFYASVKKNKVLIKKNQITIFNKNNITNDSSNSDTEDTFETIKKSFDSNDYCSLVPKNLLGNFKIKNSSIFSNPFSNNISLLINLTDYNYLKYLKIGGSHQPINCKPR
jgi:hypothetical protein